MGRERLAARQRRQCYLALRAGTLERREPTPAEVVGLFRAIDKKDLNGFGVRFLTEIELDGLHPLPASHTKPGSFNVGFERRVTALTYAAWRRRHNIVKHLLVGGARASVSDRCPDGALSSEEEAALDALLSRRQGSGTSGASAAHIVETIARLRCATAREAALAEALGRPPAAPAPCGRCGSTVATVCFDSCGCVCCEPCLWRSALRPCGGGGGDAATGQQQQQQQLLLQEEAVAAEKEEHNEKEEHDEKEDDEKEEDELLLGEIVCPCCSARPQLRGLDEAYATAGTPHRPGN